MQVTARLQYLRIAPRKLRLIADLIRGKSVEEARTLLSFTLKKGSQPLLKLLNSAVANARNNFQMEQTNLYISKIEVNEGPKYKRWRPRARGQAAEIQKKTSHINLVLSEFKEGFKKTKKVKKTSERAPQVPEKDKEVAKPKVARPKPDKEIRKPKPQKGIKRIFRRKSF